MFAFTAIPNFTAHSITFSLLTGNVPGCPNVTTEVFEFGLAPYIFSSLEYALVFVFNCACTSKPITASYLSFETFIYSKIIFLVLIS